MRMWGEADTAATRGGVQAGVELGVAKSVEQSGEQAEVHAADEGGVLLGETVEGAVAQGHVGAFEAWLEAVSLQGGQHRVVKAGTLDLGTGCMAEVSTLLIGTAVQDGAGRFSGVLGLVESGGQQVPGQVVMTGGQRHCHRVLGAGVELGGPARPWSATATASLVDGVQKALLDEPVQVEGRCGAGGADGCSGGVAPHWLWLAHHVLVEPAAGGLVESGDGRDAPVQGFCPYLCHHRSLSPTLIDKIYWRF